MIDKNNEVIKFHVDNLHVDGALSLSRELWSLPQCAAYEIDFSGLKWIQPFGMLYFSRQLKAFIDVRQPADFKFLGYTEHSDAAHMGFFQSFGLNFGNAAGAASGSATYIPITELNIRELHIEAGQSQREVQEIIEQRCGVLANVLSQSRGGPLHETLTFSLREILRNVTEHSNADSIWFAAQYWPKLHKVELSILDEGMGIQKSLSRNPHLTIESDEDALRQSLMPGISGRAFAGGPVQRNSEWANSGYGLYMTSQICVKGGSFLICSGEDALLFSKGGERKLSSGLKGTALCLIIETRELENLNEALATLNAMGSAIAKTLPAAAKLPASLASRMLSDKFPRE